MVSFACDAGGAGASQVLQVSPASLVQRSADGKVAVELEGDLGGFSVSRGANADTDAPHDMFPRLLLAAPALYKCLAWFVPSDS